MKKLALIAAAAGPTACAQGTPEVNAPSRDSLRRERAAPVARVEADALFSGPGAIVAALGGRMDGQFNGFSLNTTTYQHDFYSDGYTANGHVYGRGAVGTGSGMGIISIQGDLASAVPGQAYRSTMDAMYREAGEEGELGGSFIACPAQGDGAGWTTDEPATDVEIVIERPSQEVGIPDGTIAELSVLAHWDSAQSYSGAEGTLKTRVYLTE
jgi:hypothetical protein